MISNKKVKSKNKNKKNKQQKESRKKKIETKQARAPKTKALHYYSKILTPFKLVSIITHTMKTTYMT